ncbi:MAG: D-tyrosyl-tRNA(Tyr) deacylase [Trueperaceae bacterium]|nr:MAG: D-tyrosyl-tRNA(Tyr) deacylase [Trueperaceae bacterium]
MRCVVQRVAWAEVTVDGDTVGRIERGLLALVGVGPDDDDRTARALADKLAALRVFPDERGRMHFPVGAVGGGVLVVSQFTLFGDVTRGNRPSFIGAADPAVAEPLVAAVAARLRDAHTLTVAEGRFGAAMAVASLNDGPVTLVLDIER